MNSPKLGGGVTPLKIIFQKFGGTGAPKLAGRKPHERNRHLPDTVKAELQIKINYNLNCEEFYHSIKQNNKLLVACIHGRSYIRNW